MKEPVTLVMSLFSFSVQSQTAFKESWFDAVTSDAKDVPGIKSTMKGFESAHCLKSNYEFFTCSPLKIKFLRTLKTSSDAILPPSYQAVSPTLISRSDATAQNRRVAIFGSYSQPTQRLNLELLFQPGSNRKYQISLEHSILKESADVKTNCCYSSSENIAGNVQPVIKLSCLLNTRPSFISTNSRTNRSGKKPESGNASISTMATVGDYNSVSCSAAIPLDVLTIVHKNLSRKRKEAASSARAFSCNENRSN